MFRKTAAIGALMMLLALPAQAYENQAAGFSINDRSPQLTVQSIKSYSYTNDNFAVKNPMAIYSIYHYSAAEAAELTGCSFSTAMFEKAYDDLALLQRSELSLGTVPMPLLDLQKYAGASVGGDSVVALGMVDFSKLKPEISIGKVRGRKVITLTYYIGQNDMITYAVKTSFASDNDILYILSSAAFKYDDKADKVGEATEEAPAAAQNKDVRETAAGDSEEDLQKLKKILDIEYLTEDQVDKSLVKFSENKHQKMLKDFRTFAPSGQQNALICHDSMTGKEMKLPKEWVYANYFINKKDMMPENVELSIGLAMPLKTAVKMAENNSEFIRQVSDGNENTNLDIKTGSQPGRPAKEYMRLLLSDYDTSLTTVSFKLLENEADANLFPGRNNESFFIKKYIAAVIDETMDELKKFRNKDIFRLNNYSYDIRTAPAKLYIDLDSNVTLLNDYSLDNLFRITYGKDNTGSVLLLTEKDKAARAPEIQQIIDSWQF